MTKRDERKARARRRSQAKHVERMIEAGQPVKVRLTASPEAKLVRRTCGLEWLMTRKPARLTREQYEAGKRYGEICSEALRAQLPGNGSLAGGGGGRTDYTPSVASFHAIRERAAADAKVTDALGLTDGAAMILLLERVCHHGSTLREISGGDKAETVRLEERLKLGLVILRSYAHQRRGADTTERAA